MVWVGVPACLRACVGVCVGGQAGAGVLVLRLGVAAWGAGTIIIVVVVVVVMMMEAWNARG